MSFYNPRVRQTYELINIQHKPVKGRVLAQYGVVYRYKTSKSGKNQLEPVRYVQPFQQNNLDNIHPQLSHIMAGYIAHVWLTHPLSPMEYLYRLALVPQPDIEDSILYYSSMFKDFIEHLLYSSIASAKDWHGDKTYEHSALGKLSKKKQAFDPLIDRLKLIDYLMTHLEIVPDMQRCHVKNDECTVWVKIKIK